MLHYTSTYTACLVAVILLRGVSVLSKEIIRMQQMEMFRAFTYVCNM
jgi:hypothetical protein